MRRYKTRRPCARKARNIGAEPKGEPIYLDEETREETRREDTRARESARARIPEARQGRERGYQKQDRARERDTESKHEVLYRKDSILLALRVEPRSSAWAAATITPEQRPEHSKLEGSRWTKAFDLLQCGFLGVCVVQSVLALVHERQMGVLACNNSSLYRVYFIVSSY